MIGIELVAKIRLLPLWAALALAGCRTADPRDSGAAPLSAEGRFQMTLHGLGTRPAFAGFASDFRNAIESTWFPGVSPPNFRRTRFATRLAEPDSPADFIECFASKCRVDLAASTLGPSPEPNSLAGLLYKVLSDNQTGAEIVELSEPGGSFIRCALQNDQYRCDMKFTDHMVPKGEAEDPFGAASCPEGWPLQQFALTGINPPPTATELGFDPSVGGDAPYTFLFTKGVPTGNLNLRFDVCLKDDESEARLARLIYYSGVKVGTQVVGLGSAVPVAGRFLLEPDASATSPVATFVGEASGENPYRRIAVPPAMFKVDGLKSALFQDYSGLSATIPLADFGQLTVKERGGEDRSFVATWVEGGGQQKSVVAGDVIFGNPFGKCAPDLRSRKQTWRLGVVGIEMTGCSRSTVAGNGAAWYMEYDTMNITDPAHPPQEWREQLSLSEVFQYYSDQHHHFDDIWMVTLPHARYVWGRLQDVAEFADLNFPPAKNVFAVSYNGDPWTVGVAQLDGPAL